MRSGRVSPSSGGGPFLSPFLSLYASCSQTLYILISLVTSEISPPTCLSAPR
jgi:hypothetical protein